MLRAGSYLTLSLLTVASMAMAADMRFTATAYSGKGVTTKGNRTKAGTAAADPAIIPLGSMIRVRGAGRFSGLYAVTDTGPAITGRIIDLFIADEAKAKAFGKKQVRVKIIKVGDNVKNKPETSPIVSQSDLAPAVKTAAAAQ